MSITDRHLYLAIGQTIAAGGITDVIDRGADPSPTLANFGGFGADLYLVVKTGAGYTGTNLSVELISDSVAALNVSPTVHASTGLLPVAQLGANKQVAVLAIPPGDYERFIGARLGGTYAAGTIHVFMTRDPNYWRAMTSNNPLAQ